MVSNVMSGNVGQPAADKGARHPYGTGWGNVLATAISALSLPVEMYTRRGFGLRYVGLPVMVAGWFLIVSLFWLSVSVSNSVSGFFGSGDYDIYGNPVEAAPAAGGLSVTFFDWAYIVVALIIAGVWFWRARELEKKDIELHTYFKGDSYLAAIDALNLDNDRLQRFVEPAIIFAVGFLLRLILPGLIGWLVMLGALALLLKESLRYQAARTQYLNARDAKIEAKVMAKLMQEGGWYKVNAKPQQSRQESGYTAQIFETPKSEEEKREIADAHAAVLMAEEEGEGPVSDFHRFRDSVAAGEKSPGQ